MALAIFDLDNTLIAQDSDHLWGEFIAANGMVDATRFREANDYFYQQYQQGSLDIDEHLKFTLEPLTRYSMDELKNCHQRFMEEVIRPVMLEDAFKLIAQHREQGDHIMIITATNRFIAEPIAEAFSVDTLLAIDLEIINNRYTGNIIGIPTFQEGKVKRLNQWLVDNPGFSMENSFFYSDSKNDLPLLEQVTHPVAVDPDPELKQHAECQGWKVISLRE